MITRTLAWSYDEGNGALPPPLCFTVPARAKLQRAPMARGGGLQVSLGTPHLMADPSDPSTWQRPYRFTE